MKSVKRKYTIAAWAAFLGLLIASTSAAAAPENRVSDFSDSAPFSQLGDSTQLQKPHRACDAFVCDLAAESLVAPKSGVSTNYRKTFADAHPDVEDVVVHHGIEQQAMKRYPGAITEAEMHSLENLRGIPKDVNADVHLSEIRKEWNRFYRENPTATAEQLRLKRAEIDAKYGHQFNPPVGGE